MITRRPSDSRRGFALLITITLVAFLVLMVVSFATLTRVETQVAANTQVQSASRQNALLALNLAIGQLQKYAGPDQRVTAPSDAGTPTVNPDRSDARRHWTGVWRNTTPGAEIATRELLTWLVSGNDSPAGPLHINPTTPVADPASDSGTVWLLDENSASPAAGPGSPEGRVKLPKQPLNVATVPGLAATPGGHTIGRYAWWVGDEGVKARANLHDPHANAADGAERGFSFVTGQRASIGRMDRATSSVEIGTAFPSPADAAFDDLAKINAIGQLSLVSAAPAVMTAAAKDRFHDITVHSAGVLADVAQGGLKKDLTSALAPTATVPADADPIFPIDPGDTYGGYDVPRWERLRSYAGLQIAPGSNLAPQPAMPRVSGGQRPLGASPASFSPVVTYAGVGTDFLLAPASLDIDVHVFPLVVLWNPYTVPLAAKDYTIVFYPASADAFRLALTKDGFNPSSPVVDLWLDIPFRHNGDSSRRNLRFKITSPVIPPGQSLVFSLPATMRGAQAPYTHGLNELVNEINPDVSAVIPTNASATSPAEAYRLYARDSTREISVILSDFDPAGNYAPAGTSPYENTPRTTAPFWHQAVHRVSPIARRTDYLEAAAPLASAPPSGPAYVWDISASFSTGTRVDAQWIAHQNPRAPLFTRTKSDANNNAGFNTAYTYRARKASDLGWPGFNHDTVPRASAGQSLDNNGTPTDVTLFEITSPVLGLLSLGQLQHAPVASIGPQPAYAIGNSLAPVRIARDQTSDGGGGSTFPVSKLLTRHDDFSWKLNRALWDRYFFSTVPSGSAPSPTRFADGTPRPAWTQQNIQDDDPLPNARLSYFHGANGAPLIKQLRKTADADSNPYDEAAAHLLTEGAFNINSTSEQAWRAVLASSFGLDYRPVTRDAAPGSPAPLNAAFPRFAAPTADDSLLDPWKGYRQLDEVQIRQLAANIVAEIKTRGPFLSVADFVNRRLANDATGLKGTLQAAIDATTTGPAAANPAGTAPFDQDHVVNEPAATAGTFYLDHMRNDTAAAAAAHQSRSAFAPKFLTQADVLTALGPALAARSDTFRIRAYGETIDPLRSPGDADYITGRSWCEAIVQRIPDYVNPADAAHVFPPTHPDNIAFGRRFQIVSFRWLGPDEI